MDYILLTNLQKTIDDLVTNYKEQEFGIKQPSPPVNTKCEKPSIDGISEMIATLFVILLIVAIICIAAFCMFVEARIRSSSKVRVDLMQNI
jgi:hypothetical protein